MPHANRIESRNVLRREWRTLGRLALESAATGFFVSLVLALAVFIVSFEAHAAGSDAPGRGTLMLGSGAGEGVAAPLLATDVQMDVSGMVARVRVVQRFANPTAQWREGVYVFPLPEQSAVDHLTMHVGQRRIEGQIRERSEARRTYDNAKAEGRKATLFEQERPNMFTTRVANIGPGEEVVVALEYQQVLRYDEGAFRLRFPLAITPRYVPGTPSPSTGDETGGPPATDSVPDADRITPPYITSTDDPVNAVTIAIDLNAGFPLSGLASTYHAMDIEERPGNRHRLRLSTGAAAATRDFELVWTPDVGAAPGAALFTETRGDKNYALLMALPPSAPGAAASRAPREITYVIDTSGSMEGVSISQAREALDMALDRLLPGDRFNVIEFNSTSTPLFTSPMPVDAATLARAKQFVRALRARGGTEMLPALKFALAGGASSVRDESHRVRQVIFLTDGAVGNEDEILRLVHEQLGDRRLFTIGIGPSPNTFFLTKAAQSGRGTFTFIGDVREVKEKMSSLFRKLESPALTDIAIAWPAGADAWPRRVPDLYAGEPVVVTAQFPSGAVQDNVSISGRRAGADWQALLPVTGGAPEPGVAVLWARARIDALMDAGRQGAPEQDIRQAVLDIALAHHLVSKYTSMVAVDVTPTRAAGVDLFSSNMPGSVPEGLTGFSQLPRTATPAMLLLCAGVALILAAFILLLRRAPRAVLSPDPAAPAQP
ncbi:MAG TPA: marine proteobacterial sortase target protein [Casimicrobiaceae bacterium]|nr:marine proteobacterial sortase target protein [Casimicrobiaceae bacterium]